jgi:ATP-dependent DNA ligase
MTRYFPELVEAIKDNLPERCVVDGEIVVVVGDRLEFDVLQQRIHPAASRVDLLAQQTPTSFIAFDLLAEGDTDYTGRPFAARRAALEKALAPARPPIHLNLATTDYTDTGELASVGVIGAFPEERRKELFAELQPMVTTFDDHPWAWAKQEQGTRTPRNAEGSRWSAGKDLSFTPLRPELVVEVRYEHMEGIRFRHTAQFNRWRPDRDPRSCTYEQLEEPVKFDLAEILQPQP